MIASIGGTVLTNWTFIQRSCCAALGRDTAVGISGWGAILTTHQLRKEIGIECATWFRLTPARVCIENSAPGADPVESTVDRAGGIFYLGNEEVFLQPV